MEDINPDAQPVDAAAAVSTFIIMKDTLSGPRANIIMPVFRAYVDVPSEGYEDIDPTSYSATRSILDAYLNIAQPDDIAGVWWCGETPDDSEDAKYSYRGTTMILERFTVEYLINIK